MIVFAGVARLHAIDCVVFPPTGGIGDSARKLSRCALERNRDRVEIRVRLAGAREGGRLSRLKSVRDASAATTTKSIGTS
jgi:hypothetical protein